MKFLYFHTIKTKMPHQKYFQNMRFYVAVQTALAEVGESAEKVWKSDLMKIKKDFWEDQRRNRPRETNNKFNLVTYRIALAIYYRSPAAYKALRDFDILALPSESSLKRITSRNSLGAGIHESKIADQVDAFKTMNKARVAKGLKETPAEGALIFDEVKVAVGVSWNSQSHTISSEATTPLEAANLHNVFQTLDSKTSEPTSHILQTLWRCVVADCDIIGPYFTSSSTLSAEIMLEHIMDVVRTFELFGLHVALLIGDGASSNLSTFKRLLQHEG
eukprot:Pompholyxophrys_punicea_v1_NODE_786_length_1302_cov_2.549318.p1 type:complete len:275 gc:universal NODE_786_length_1302_cov_2.549318:77-901(+)